MSVRSLRSSASGRQAFPDASTDNASRAWEMRSHIPGSRSESRLVSVWKSVKALDPWELLQTAAGSERFYWVQPSCSNGLTLCGVGVAAEIRIPPILNTADLTDPFSGQRFAKVEHEAERLFSGAIMRPFDRLDSAPDGSALPHPARPRLFGGFAFQDDFVPDHTWSVFNAAHFVVPHFQLVVESGQAFLTVNALLAREDDLVEGLHGLREALTAKLASLNMKEPARPELVETAYPMSYESWTQMIRRALSAIAQGGLEKVVLSRVCEARCASPIDATAAIDYLDANYGDCYRFLFEPVPEHAFFGATPELLISKTGDHVRTMALAGSAARGASPEEDGSLAGRLLTSPKDLQEHQLVVVAIRERLRPITSELSIGDKAELMQLRNIQHLLTSIQGRLSDPSTSILALVRLLHPTPALGGEPRNRALTFLREAEVVPRGWYAAPIGWLDAYGNGEFAVAIRSAVTQHDRAWLYAGAGIVTGSDPGHEWDETALKFRPILGALEATGS